MVYWQTHYHLVWGTKYREDSITPDIENYLFTTIRNVGKNDLKLTLFAINGTHDHIHIAVAIPPSISVSQWVKHTKGASSLAINNHFRSRLNS